MAIIVLAIMIALAFSFYPKTYQPVPSNTPSDRELKIQSVTLQQATDFQDFIRDSLESPFQRLSRAELQKRFLKARLLYKRYEWAAEYFMGSLARRVNGPPVEEVENADLRDPSLSYAQPPSGLQVIEEDLYPHLSDRKKLLQDIAFLKKNAGFLVSYFHDQPMADWRILDGAKLQIFRIVTLGITGFDDPLTLHSMQESSESLQYLKKVIAFYVSPADPLLRTIDQAISYLNQHPDFNTFDRAHFIITYANPISTGIAKLQVKLQALGIHYNRMLNQTAETLFDPTAFNVNAFAPDTESFYSRDKFDVGKALFFDKNLSGTGTRSCATCHQPELAFTDGLAKNTNLLHPNELLPRNTPTLLEAALQSNFFDDMRALTLEEQAMDVLQNPDEMDGHFPDILDYIAKSPRYQKLFAKAYPGQKITAKQVANALASFTRGLTYLNSRFDQYMRGDKSALNADEVAGFNLFAGKAKCATCHYLPLFNGTVPPKYVQSEAEVIGVPVSLSRAVIDPDEGWYKIIGVDSYKYAFKTPTLRNIARTAPYMHNGVYKTLEQVMDFYNNGGGSGLGIHLRNQTLSMDSLHLSKKEIQQIIAFMKSLNDHY